MSEHVVYILISVRLCSFFVVVFLEVSLHHG